MANRDNQRLVKSIEWSRFAMEPFRRKRLETLKIMYGAHWNDQSVRKSQPMNMLELTIRIWLRNLIARNPSVDVIARKPELRPQAKDFSLVMRNVVREIGLKDSMADVAFDALTGPIGVAKVGITDRALGESSGYLHDAGYPFADAVDFDDLALDMSANRWEAQVYMGNRYVLPYEDVMDSKLFKKTPYLKPDSAFRTYDENGNQNVADLTKAAAGWSDDREAIDMIRLWDFWIPRERVMLTFACNAAGLPCEEPVRTVEWTGPEVGPFHMLTFGKGKGILRLPPIASLRDLNDAINRAYRKLLNQADRQKTITGVMDDSAADADRVINASDGQSVRMSNPNGIKEFKYGGADPATMQLALTFGDKFSYLAGNLDAQGGLAQAGDTLGQEELLKQSASQTIEDMQATMVGFTKDVCTSIASHVWYDPETVYRIDKPLGNSGITLPVEVGPDDREESAFLEFGFDIRPTSMQDIGNAQRLRGLVNAFEKIILPGAAAIQQQGMMVDMGTLVQNIAELSGTDEIAELLVHAPQQPPGPEGVAPAGESGSEQPSKPPITRREYIRRSVPTGGTRSARDNVMSQVLAGGGVTPQQGKMMERRPA